MILIDKIRVLINFKESKLLGFLRAKRKLHLLIYLLNIEIPFEQILIRITG
jgi:hypothetical protein